MYQIIHSEDKFISDFLNSAIPNFYKEIAFFARDNSDNLFLKYANERSLASQFVNGIIRNDNDWNISAIQEYTTEFKEEKRYGRPDIFLKCGENVIYIECKYDREKAGNGNHWKPEKWVEWDNSIYNKVLAYYNTEKKDLIKVTGGYYIMTMAFHLIAGSEITHEEEAMENMIKDKIIFDRDWYYTFNNKIFSNGKASYGLEVYGTFKKM